MRIKRTAKIAFFLIISAVLTFGVIIIFLNQTMEAMHEDLRKLAEIRRTFDKLRAVSIDYFLYQPERAHQQWWALQKDVLTLIANPEYQFFLRKYHFENLGDRMKLMGDAFTKLTTAIEKKALSEPEAEANKDLQNRLITQKILTAMEIVASLDTISENIRNDVALLQRRSKLFELVALAILIVFISGNFTFLLRSVVQPILQLHEGAGIIGRGDLDYRVKIAGPGEIRELSQAFNAMSTNLKKLMDSLQKSKMDLQHLTSQLITTQEQERKRISLELHEGLGQSLTALKMHLRVIQRHLTGPVELQEDFDHAQNYLKEIVEDVRRISQGLSPSLLEDVGLAAAITYLFDELSKCQGVAITSDTDDIYKLFPPQTETNIFRIFQESLNNIAKHSQATHVSVSIKKQDGCVDFCIKDNGVGFDIGQVTGGKITNRGMGLAAIGERLQMIGGHLDIASQQGKGTEINFSIPINAE
jgi:signal transduction histidine kinase